MFYGRKDSTTCPDLRYRSGSMVKTDCAIGATCPSLFSFILFISPPFFRFSHLKFSLILSLSPLNRRALCAKFLSRQGTVHCRRLQRPLYRPLSIHLQISQGHLHLRRKLPSAADQCRLPQRPALLQPQCAVRSCAATGLPVCRFFLGAELSERPSHQCQSSARPASSSPHSPKLCPPSLISNCPKKKPFLRWSRPHTAAGAQRHALIPLIVVLA